MFILFSFTVFSLHIPQLGLSQLFENDFGNNRCPLEYENYSSLTGLPSMSIQTADILKVELPSYKAAVDDVEPLVDAQDW